MVNGHHSQHFTYTAVTSSNNLIVHILMDMFITLSQVLFPGSHTDGHTVSDSCLAPSRLIFFN